MDQFSGDGSAPTVRQALLGLVQNPWRRVLRRFNSKAALLSAIFRGAIFLAASIKSHHAGRSGAALAEAVYGATCSGFFGTLAQALRFATPQWQAQLVLAGIFPVLFQIGDYCFHSALEGHVIRSGMIASAVFTALSALFNLYVMRRGTLLVGDEGKPFYHDLGTLPKLALFFVISGVMAPWRMIAGFFREAPGRAVTPAASTESASS
jgi:hypothetical protein